MRRNKKQSKASNIRKSTTIIPIYQLLIEKQSDHPIQKLIHQIETAHQFDKSNNEDTLRRSFLIFVFKICGLEQISNRIDWRHPTQSIKEIMQQIYEQPNLAKGQPHDSILNPKNSNFVFFKKRFEQFLNTLISEELQISFESSLLQDILEWIKSLSTCKVRSVRASALQLMRFILERQTIFYNQLIDQRKASKANSICINIEQYLMKVIKPRIKDVDNGIRKILSGSILNIMTQLPGQFIKSNILDELFTPILMENSNLMITSMTNLRQIYQSAPKQVIKDLITYTIKIRKHLEDKSLLPNIIGLQALRILLLIFKADPNLKILKSQHIYKLFQIFGAEGYFEGLQLVVQSFYYLLNPLNEQLDSKIVIIEILNILSSPQNKRVIRNIITAFLDFNPKFLVLDDLFLLLLSQFYNLNDTNVPLGFLQTDNLLCIIVQIAEYVRRNKDSKKKQWCQQIKVSYNNYVLTNCKEILLDKINNKKFLAHLYLSLYSHLFTPLQGSSIANIDYIIQRAITFFSQGTEGEIISQTVNIFYNFQTHSIDLLSKHIDLRELQNDRQKELLIIKISCLLSKYDIPRLMDKKIVEIILRYFLITKNVKLKVEIISYAYMSHLWKMKNMTQFPNLQNYQTYNEIRSIVFFFLFEVISNDHHISNMLRVSGFMTLCKILKMCSNSELFDVDALYYELRPDQEKLLVSFVEERVHLISDQNGDLSLMMNNMSFYESEARNQVIKQLLEVYQANYRLASTKRGVKILAGLYFEDNYKKLIQSLFIKLIKKQIQQTNNNRFVYWKLVWEFINVFDKKQKKEFIVNKVMELYFMGKRTPAINKIYVDKLVLFLAQAVDKALQRQQYQKLSICQMILKKIYRRLNKAFLHRFSLFFNSKAPQSTQDPNIISFKKYLTKLNHSANGNNNSDEQNDNDQNDQNQESEQQKVVIPQRRSLRSIKH